MTLKPVHGRMQICTHRKIAHSAPKRHHQKQCLNVYDHCKDTRVITRITILIALMYYLVSIVDYARGVRTGFDDESATPSGIELARQLGKISQTQICLEASSPRNGPM